MKTRGKIEQLWRQEKYHVMMHSQQHYNHIRAMLKSTPTYAEVESAINEALSQSPTMGSMINCYDHMWDYFKSKATDAEKQHAQYLKHAFQQQQVSFDVLLTFIKSLADRYHVHYLQQSHILQQRPHQ